MVERISKQQKQGQLVDGHCSATENLAALPKHNSFEGLESSEFENDLKKYQDVSELIREVFNVFSGIPKTKRKMAKMMMKLLKPGKDDGKPRPRPRPKPRPTPIFRPGNRPSNKPILKQGGMHSSTYSYIFHLQSTFRN